jgi:thiol-disulfide isomerase/thioredoxin
MIPLLPRLSRRRAFAAAFAAVACLAAGATAGRVAAQGGWQLPGLDGGAISSGDVGEGTTVMVVWAGWSPRCRDIVDKSNAMVGSWDGRARVVMVDFQEEPAEVSAFLAGKGARAAVYLDGDGSFSKQHRVTTLPGLVVYRDGEVVYQGKLPDDPDAVIGGAVR